VLSSETDRKAGERLKGPRLAESSISIFARVISRTGAASADLGNDLGHLKPPDQFFVSAPGVFLVGSGVSGLDAPVFLVVAGGAGAAFASLGVTPGVLSEPGAEGSTGFSASAGVPAKSNVAKVKPTAAFFI
jgi:hypothetical protein